MERDKSREGREGYERELTFSPFARNHSVSPLNTISVCRMTRPFTARWRAPERGFPCALRSSLRVESFRQEQPRPGFLRRESQSALNFSMAECRIRLRDGPGQLRRRFQQQHTRHERMAGEVAAQKISSPRNVYSPAPLLPGSNAIRRSMKRNSAPWGRCASALANKSFIRH